MQTHKRHVYRQIYWIQSGGSCLFCAKHRDCKHFQRAILKFTKLSGCGKIVKFCKINDQQILHKPSQLERH